MQDGFLVVDMHARLKGQLRNQRGVYIHETHGRVLRENMPAALRAPLPKTDRRLVVSTNARGTVRHLQRIRLPQRKGIDGSRRPVTTGFTMTVPHRSWLSRNLKLHLAAKAAPLVNFIVAHAVLLIRCCGYY